MRSCLSLPTVLALVACGDGSGPADVVASDGYRVLYAGAWDDDAAALAVALPAADDALGRPGAPLAPQAVAVVDEGLLVLDPAGRRIVALGLDAARVEAFRVGAELASLVDLVVDRDGVAWAVDGARGGLVRLDAGGAVASPIAPELAGLTLLTSGDGDVWVGTPDGLGTWYVHSPLGPVALESQRESGGHLGSPMAVNAHVRVAEPPATGLELVDAFQVEHAVALPGAALEVVLFDLVVAGPCAGSLVVVASALVDGAMAHVAVRTDLQGVARAQVSAPAPAPFHTPSRPFALAPDGRLFQLRIEGGGYAIVQWDLGCP